MEKKQYIEPNLVVHELTPIGILAGSDSSSSQGFKYGGGSDDPYHDARAKRLGFDVTADDDDEDEE